MKEQVPIAAPAAILEAVQGVDVGAQAPAPNTPVADGQVAVIKIPPSFTTQLPTTKQTKTENDTLSYSCTAQAKPAAAILWTLNGQNLTNTPPYNISVSFVPADNSKLFKSLAYLSVDKVTWRQNGTFSCLAVNNAGEKSQTTDLEIRRKYRQFFIKEFSYIKGTTIYFW
ncbi:hypothetical protein OS493_031128 [Desmophyllum pertusum]|uniref:Ig-like domain-containing protein n=1 Tax=Desmophyllum pertusum TaxID=174260 RepID=A0A9W9Y8J6_9CNID|nr:hypothetical protein OS493_031128 [Desmophyllum pertusum]